VSGGLSVLVSGLRLAGQRAGQHLAVEAERGGAAVRRPRPAAPREKRRQASTPPTFIGRSSKSLGEDETGLEVGVCTTPIEVWMRPGPSSGSGGGTPGSGGGQEIGSSSDGQVQDRQHLIS